jgi:hypothetical protein
MRFLTVWCQRSILPWIIGWYPFDRSRCAKRTETHSARRLAARITFPHFCVSLAISLAKSAGAPGGTMNPRSANRALILGLARAALISLLSRRRSRPACLRAPMPCQSRSPARIRPQSVRSAAPPNGSRSSRPTDCFDARLRAIKIG